MLRDIPFKNLENATNHVKQTLGEGNLGPVFRGRLLDGTDVAIKMRSDGLQLNADSFLKEVCEILGQLDNMG